jgi:hypothetical protein
MPTHELPGYESLAAVSSTWPEPDGNQPLESRTNRHGPSAMPSLRAGARQNDNQVMEEEPHTGEKEMCQHYKLLSTLF